MIPHFVSHTGLPTRTDAHGEGGMGAPIELLVRSIQAHRETPDLVLMDLSLPEIDGLEAARRLKAGASTARVPIIALTAHAMRSDQERALAAGCDEFETKPVDFDRLLGKIAALTATATDLRP